MRPHLLRHKLSQNHNAFVAQPFNVLQLHLWFFRGILWRKLDGEYARAYGQIMLSTQYLFNVKRTFRHETRVYVTRVFRRKFEVEGNRVLGQLCSTAHQHSG